jgi:hypothetical protein
LKQNWGQYMTSCTFNWRMMKTIFTGEGCTDGASGGGGAMGRCCFQQHNQMNWRR